MRLSNLKDSLMNEAVIEEIFAGKAEEVFEFEDIFWKLLIF